MTTLDSFLKKLPKDLHLISGRQKTARSLFLSYSQSDFFKLIDNFSKEQFIFRFLEKQEEEFIIHFGFIDENFSIELSIEVKNTNLELNTKLRKYFPSAEIYLSEFF